jgi:hypothetical protein
MNTGRWVIGSVVILVFFYLYEYLVHGILLLDMYMEISSIFRPEGETSGFFIWMLLGTLIFSLGFGYIFIKGREGKGIAEGFRFGLLIGVVIFIPMVIGDYALYPIPAQLAVFQAISYIVEMIVAGIIFAAIYEPPRQQAA